MNDHKKWANEDLKIFFAMVEQLTGTSQTEERKKDILLFNVQQRMALLAFKSFKSYLLYVCKNTEELKILISLVTIHTTQWFREKPHFDIFKNFIAISRNQHPFYSPRSYRMWVPGCSSGEEVYSYYLVARSINAAIKIVGTDIDDFSLELARKQSYDLRLDQIPECFHALLLLNLNKITLPGESLKDCSFLCEDIRNHPINERYDIISCRNLLIYFESPEVDKIINVFFQCLNPGGLLILGHSEMISNYQQYEDDDGYGFCLINNNCYEKKIRNKLKNHSETIIIDDAVLIVDDVEVARIPLRAALQKSGLKVFESSSTREAHQLLDKNNQAILAIILDIQMPEENGLVWLKRLRQMGYQQPVIISSSSSPDEVLQAMGSLVEEAQEFFVKDFVYQNIQIFTKTVLELAKQFKYTKKMKNTSLAIQRNLSSQSHVSTSQFSKHPIALKSNIRLLVEKNPTLKFIEVILVGASTGGPLAIFQLLRNLARPFPPIVIVQHMPIHFTVFFAKTLEQLLNKNAKEGVSPLIVGKISEGEVLHHDRIYISQEDAHVELMRLQPGKRLSKLSVKFVREPAVNSIRPTVNHLFFSAAKLKINSLALLLTGMGSDGAQGLKALKDSECGVTMVQDEESSVVYGMPKEAIKLGAAHYQGNLQGLQDKVNEYLKQCYNYFKEVG